ncbi:MAG: type III pantothenate kinase [Candidatus Saccharicenans sp.]|nr:MAG: pantothenate kinase [Candidatus Aminicenantes bacterium]HEK84796.1 type III pantothenate kinase [Candidatus Aminicenantes bacterium]
MLMVFDIGNTTIGMGIFQGKKLLAHWKLKSDREKTADEYGIIFGNLLNHQNLSGEKINGAIISSVVPPLTPIIQTACQNFFKIKPLVVGPGLKTGIPILYENPAEVGSDRIVVAAAAYEKYGGPCLVVDFGTATTFDAISAAGEYLGGAIAPGIQIAAEALYLRTAKLPRIEIKKPKSAIGRNTVASMQSGLYFGYLGLVNNIIAEISKELTAKPKVIATGGLAELVVSDIPVIDHLEPDLVLEGLRLLFEKNKRPEKK